MRVTGGQLCGRRLEMPAGGHVRPTQDRVRESLFAILTPRLAGARFLDLYAGSGAAGIEAWSRGAADVCWVEGNGRVARALRANVRTLCGGAGTVVVRDVFRYLKTRLVSRPFDIIFADPPYEEHCAAAAEVGWGGPGALLELIGAGGWLAPGGVCVLEQASRHAAEPADGWRCVDERTYGIARLVFMAPKTAGEETAEHD